MSPKYTIKKIQPFVEQYVKIHTIEYCGSGDHCDAFCVNTNLVFKFPKHTKANASLQNEIALLKRLSNIFELEIPNVLFEGTFMECNNVFTFSAAQKLHGAILTKTEFLALDHTKQEKAARTIARFLKTLHLTHTTKKRKDYVLLHGDFSLNHIMFQHGEVSGILDFADSRIGIYKSDFIYLLDDDDPEEFGAQFGEMVLAYYLQL